MREPRSQNFESKTFVELWEHGVLKASYYTTKATGDKHIDSPSMMLNGICDFVQTQILAIQSFLIRLAFEVNLIKKVDVFTDGLRHLFPLILQGADTVFF